MGKAKTAKPKSTVTKSVVTVTKLRALQRFALFFFRRPRLTAIIVLIITLFGILSYTTLLKREGFPAIDVPYAIGQGTYFVDNAAQVDEKFAKPVSNFLLEQPEVKSVQTNSQANFAMVIVQYTEGTNSEETSKRLQEEIKQENILPPSASLKFDAAKFGFSMRGDDAIISFISTKQPDAKTLSLVDAANDAAEYLNDKNLSLVKNLSVIPPVETSTNPFTGQQQSEQTRFERYGERANDSNNFYGSVAIGATSKQGSDVIEYDAQLQQAIDEYNAAHKDDGYALRLSASYAPSIKQQIGELQKTLLEGLIAVLIIGSIVIAVRASAVTVLSMVTVILATLGLLELIGYSLNTITLFALILSLSLIVDDTIIVVEALDAQRKKKTDPDDIVKTAVGKVGRAMIAATSTAALSFAPLLFVGGILGTFIRAIPTTIISALLISLLVALAIIPFYSRWLLLGKKNLGAGAEHEIAAGFEAAIARFLSKPMLWAQHKRGKLVFVCISAVVVSMLFIGAGGYLFQKVTFNIFPPSKDTNQISLKLTFPQGTTVETAEATAARATTILGRELGETFEHTANYGQATAQNAEFFINLTDYNSRKQTAPELIDQLETAFGDFAGAQVSATTIDAGPPPSNFTARVAAEENRAGAIRLADDVAAYIKSADIRRLDDTKVVFDQVGVDNTDAYTRADGENYIGVTASFVETDTTAQVNATKSAVEEAFPPSKVASYGVPSDALTYDFGQEDENQDSFKTMAIAFPIVLAVIYVVLSFQFRSLLQPLLIFMAIPFSLFGITLGLWLTDNPFSFFAMLGFFALIGLSIKNTILLTDYANQSRRAGMNPVDAAHEALAERFRPLIATSLTAIVSLIPLALSSPFWQGLAVVLMFGLLSSTFLVVTVFPYYYLIGEFMRGVWRRQVTSRVRRVFASVVK